MSKNTTNYLSRAHLLPFQFIIVKKGISFIISEVCCDLNTSLRSKNQLKFRIKRYSYYQLMKIVKILLFFLVLLVLVSAFATAEIQANPVPFCSLDSPNAVDQPITYGELQRYDLDNYISGFNLTHVLVENTPEITKKLTNKVNLVKIVHQGRTGQISHKLYQDGLKSTLILLSRNGDTSLLSYGSTTDQALLPAITDTTVLEQNAALVCYDAVWLQLDNLAVVDCSETNGDSLRNFFFVVNTQSHLVVSKIENPLALPAVNAGNRKLRIFEDDQKRLFVRAYVSASADTVAEVWSFVNPLTPRLVQTVDKNSLKLNSFVIQDIQIDQNSIYVLEATNGVFRLASNDDETVAVVERAQISGKFTKLSVFSTVLGNRRKIAVASEGKIVEFDWVGATPKEVYSYTVPAGACVNLILNEEFVVAQISQIYSATSVYIFRGRKQSTFQRAHSVLSYASKTLISFDQKQSQLITIQSTNMVQWAISSPMLDITSNLQRFSTQISFTVKATSAGKDGLKAECFLPFTFILFNEDSLALWPTLEKIPDTVVSQTNFARVELSPFVYGSNVTYGVYSVQENYPGGYVLKRNESEVSWAGPSPSLSFTHFVTVTYSESAFLQFWQDSTNKTFVAKCSAAKEANVDCAAGAQFEAVTSRIVSLAAANVIVDSTFLQVAAIAQTASLQTVTLFNALTAKAIGKPIVFAETEKIVSVAISGVWLIVALEQNGLGKIATFDLTLLTKTKADTDLPSAIFSKSLGVKIVSAVTSAHHSNLLFIQSDKKLSVYQFSSTDLILITEIVSQAILQGSWSFSVSKHYLLVANSYNRVEEYSLRELHTSNKITFLKPISLYTCQMVDPIRMVASPDGNLTYLIARDTALPSNQTTVLLTIQSGYASMFSIYTAHALKTSLSSIHIGVSSHYSADFVTTAIKDKMTAVRIYEKPVLVFNEWSTNFSANITYTNDRLDRFRYQSKINVVYVGPQSHNLRVELD